MSDTHLLTFEINPGEPEQDGLPANFSGVAYSGGIIPGYGPFGDAAIDLSTLKISDKAIFALLDHDHSKRVGKITASIKDNRLEIAGKFFKSTAPGKEVAAMFAEGAPWQMSVGIQSQADVSKAHRQVSVNGQELSVRTIFKNASLREVSFVPVGADPNTSVAAFSKNHHHHEEPRVELDELKAKVSALETELGEEKKARQLAESALHELKQAVRKDAIAALSAKLGKTLTPEELAGFSALDDSAFAFVSAQLLSVTPPKADSSLFQEFATGTGGTSPTEADEALKARSLLFSQVSGAQ